MTAHTLGLPVRPVVDLHRLAGERLYRLRRALATEHLDAVLLTSPESVSYATGYVSVGSVVFRGWRAAALITMDDALLVLPSADIAPAVDAGFPVDRVVPFGRFYFESATADPVAEAADVHPDLPAATGTALHRAGLRPGTRVGVEDLAGNSALAAALDGLDAVEAGQVMTAVRAVKLPGEVELLTYGARLVDAGIDAALAAAGAGITELELAGVIGATISAGGGLPRFIVSTTGPRTALADAPATDRAWRAGELARFDVGCTIDGYWADIGRTAVLGEPDAQQAARYAAILAGEDEQFRRARPGITAAEVFDAAVATVEHGGIRPYRRHHCGHGIGQSVYEAPIISPAVDTPLQAGMTFCFETPYYEVGWGGMMVEDLVLVTDDGVRVLTDADRDLRVVAA
ncbi:Xaa-Pro peptidase family protein [Pseudonocardia adelaidensis]|uniref:M24 family metallopeptidase n=1 Tax=Pseudonocardia adelaidensis TaxID=648754 RepID=A0ABP9NCR8_9PSEU